MEEHKSVVDFTRVAYSSGGSLMTVTVKFVNWVYFQEFLISVFDAMRCFFYFNVVLLQKEVCRLFSLLFCQCARTLHACVY